MFIKKLYSSWESNSYGATKPRYITLVNFNHNSIIFEPSENWHWEIAFARTVTDLPIQLIYLYCIGHWGCYLNPQVLIIIVNQADIGFNNSL